MTTGPSKLFIRASLAILCLILLVGCSLLWYVSSFETAPGAMIWLATSFFILMCLIGLGVVALLNFFIHRPAERLADDLNRILDGDHSAENKISGALSVLQLPLSELIERYENRLGFSQSILNGLPMPCVTVDTEQRITFVNQECLDMLGMKVKADSFHGRMISQIFYRDDRKSLIGTCMDDDTRAMNREAVFKHADGSDIHVLANLFPLHDVQGTVIGGCCIYLDTTRLKQNETEILTQNQCIAKAGEATRDIALELTTAAQQLGALVTTARDGAREQTGRTSETASAMEQMYASVIEVARHATDATNNADAAKNDAENGSMIVTEMVEAIDQVALHAAHLKTSMEELDTRADSIGKVLSVIEDIADQTNLLALNAAIEAARAGDAGRGFAVVADEVRKLAEKTMQATTEVHRAISGIQEGARDNVKATETAVAAVAHSTELAGRSGEALTRIVTTAETTADQVRAIAAAAAQQSTASDEINRATMDVNRISDDTDRAMQESSEAVVRLAQLAESLTTAIEEMK